MCVKEKCVNEWWVGEGVSDRASMNTGGFSEEACVNE